MGTCSLPIEKAVSVPLTIIFIMLGHFGAYLGFLSAKLLLHCEELLAKQYWLSCFQSHHPSHHLTFHPAPTRNRKGTLSIFDRDVGPLCDDAISEVEQYRSALHNLHSQAVVDAQSNFVPQSLELLRLNYYHSNATFLDPSALLLLSYVWVTAGSSNSYKAHITAGVTDVCPDCGVAPHSVEHLFQCPAYSTQLTTQDLWDDPDTVADFLKLDDN